MTALTVIEPKPDATTPPMEVLTCRLGDEEYGIDILAVQEIRRFERPTRIANSALHLLGITNLRGVIVPIVDLRRLLGLPAENGVNTVTVIVNVGSRTLGLVVDAVSDVVALTPEQVQPRPGLGSQVAADFITGLATLQGADATRMLLLINLVDLLRDF